MRKFTSILCAGILLTIAATANAQTATTPKRLPMQMDGPLMVSPWFTAAQPTANTAKDHYIYSSPPPIYWGGYGYYPWSFAPFVPYYGGPRHVIRW